MRTLAIELAPHHIRVNTIHPTNVSTPMIHNDATLAVFTPDVPNPTEDEVGGMGAHGYSAAKAAVIGLSQSVAAELRPKGIRVNAIVPGAVVTAMTADIVVGDPGDLAGATEAMQATALMSRPGLPEDIAAGALYLASDDAAFVTGSTLVVDGGLTWAPGTSPYGTRDFETPVGLLEGGRRSTANSGGER
jgi:NAD(P)-dependent dehydrogenase (short-subunit alcohol dehydrogenase family)